VASRLPATLAIVLLAARETGWRLWAELERGCFGMIIFIAPESLEYHRTDATLGANLIRTPAPC
jgi:hypothetical protein